MTLYFQRLGEFIHTFSAIERDMQHLLWHFAGVSKRKGKALFSGVKAAGAIDLINKIVENRSQKVRDDLGYIFAQLKLINNARNHMLHQQVKKVSRDYLVISNSKTVFKKTSIREVTVSPEILKNMTDDLHKIRTHIEFYTEGNTSYFKTVSPRFLSAAWLYKPPAQSNQCHSLNIRRQNKHTKKKSSLPLGS